MPLVVDMLGQEVMVPAQPRRIVSLVPSQTELLADLGLEDEVAGITKFCVHPDGWFRSKPRVGGTKTVHIERVAHLKPDLIIANKEENVEEQVMQLKQVAPVWVSDIHTLPDALEMISQVSAICNRQQEGEDIAARIRTSFHQLGRAAEVRAAYSIWYKPWMWAGNDTFIHDIMLRCGLVNVFHDTPRYPEMDLERLKALRPEVVLLSSEPYPFKQKHAAEVQAALPDTKVLLADGEMFSWYGSRLLHTAEYLTALLPSL
jgi:ABC-type Fe3+-hydroxamate transport system substrate-binding protein